MHSDGRPDFTWFFYRYSSYSRCWQLVAEAGDLMKQPRTGSRALTSTSARRHGQDLTLGVGRDRRAHQRLRSCQHRFYLRVSKRCAL